MTICESLLFTMLPSDSFSYLILVANDSDITYFTKGAYLLGYGRPITKKSQSSLGN